jgi:hypothetical protein
MFWASVTVPVTVPFWAAAGSANTAAHATAPERRESPRHRFLRTPEETNNERFMDSSLFGETPT